MTFTYTIAIVLSEEDSCRSDIVSSLCRRRRRVVQMPCELLLLWRCCYAAHSTCYIVRRQQLDSYAAAAGKPRIFVGKMLHNKVIIATVMMFPSVIVFVFCTLVTWHFLYAGHMTRNYICSQSAAAVVTVRGMGCGLILDHTVFQKGFVSSIMWFCLYVWEACLPTYPLLTHGVYLRKLYKCNARIRPYPFTYNTYTGHNNVSINIAIGIWYNFKAKSRYIPHIQKCLFMLDAQLITNSVTCVFT